MNALDLNDFLLSRQPILDLDEALVGYALSLQPRADDSASEFVRSRTAALVCAAYAEFGLHNALGRSKAFIPADLDFIHDDAIEALPPDAVVLELVFDEPPDKATLERCRTLRERRYSLALANYCGLDERSTPLLTLIDIVKIDTQKFDDVQIGELAGSLARLPIRLLATGVDTQERMKYCRELNFHFLQGRYFAHPELVSGRRLIASQAGLIQLINLVGHDAETAKIEEGIKREPALTVNLLRIVNSVGYGLTRRITSLRHAITILGRRQFQRWLQLLLMAPSGKSRDVTRSPLLQVAALRGRMMELLVGHIHPRDAQLSEQAFITGIMSMMPAALALPIKEIFEQIVLETEVMDALLSHAGTLGRILALLESFDNEDSAGCDTLIGEFSEAGLTRNTLNTALAEALRWINAAENET